MLYAILSDPLAAAAEGNFVVNVFALRSRWQNHRCSRLPLADNKCGTCCVQPIPRTYLTPEQCVGHCPSSLPSKHKFNGKALGLWGFSGLIVLWPHASESRLLILAVWLEKWGPCPQEGCLCHYPLWYVTSLCFDPPSQPLSYFCYCWVWVFPTPSGDCTVCHLGQSTLPC